MEDIQTKKLKELEESQIIALAIFERQLFSWPWPLDNWYGLADSSRNIFASFIELDERIVGVCVFEVSGPDFCHLYKIIVDPIMRRKSFAKKLFKAMIDCVKKELNDTFTIYLEVEETNRGAIAFYESLGLETIYKKPKFYQNGRAALIMQCGSSNITYDKP